METLVFWAFPVLAALIGLNRPALAGWRGFVCAAAALYLGVWIAPLWVGLLDFLPSEAEPYRFGAALLITSGVVFTLLFCAARAIMGDDDDFKFPTVAEKIFNVVCHAGFGIALAALLFTVCCTTPLRTFIRKNGDGFERWAASTVLKASAVGDALTFCTPKEPRAEALAKLWYRPPAPPEAEKPQTVAAPPPEAEKPQAAAAPASPAENQARKIVSRGLKRSRPRKKAPASPAEPAPEPETSKPTEAPATTAGPAAADKPAEAPAAP